MALANFQAVQNFITQVLTTNGNIGDVATSPHKSFWTTLTYDEFVNGNVPGVKDGNGNPIPILKSGNSANSNLILSLQGKGPLFDPSTGLFGQMPFGDTPFTAAQIQEIADWIDAGCPK